MRVGIVGCGQMGTIHAMAARKVGQNVVACSDPLKSRAKKLARAFGAADWSDCLGMIRDSGVDILVVSSPADSQSENILSALKGGQPVFAVAPMARTPA